MMRLEGVWACDVLNAQSNRIIKEEDIIFISILFNCKHSNSFFEGVSEDLDSVFGEKGTYQSFFRGSEAMK
jgi:hypothetical protein